MKSFRSKTEDSHIVQPTTALAIRDNLQRGVHALGDAQVGRNEDVWQTEITEPLFLEGLLEHNVEVAADVAAESQEHLDYRPVMAHEEGNGDRGHGDTGADV